ncbi:MAG: outer membrane beta-barrel protein [Gemmatimonadales bacterium]
MATNFLLTNVEVTMRFLATALTVTFPLLLAASAVSAQQVPKHKGYWIGFGIGGGWNLSNTIGGKSTGGGGAFLRMGGSPSQNVLLGGELIGFGTKENGVSYGRGNLNVIVMYYLDVKRGLYVKGGVGGASFTTSVVDDNTRTTTTDNGFGAGAGVGWDVRLGSNFYLTPALDFLYQRVSVGDNEATNNTMALLNVGITWH